MSNQGEDGWYPECDKCGEGNLGNVYCSECYLKLKAFAKNLIEAILDNLESCEDAKIDNTGGFVKQQYIADEMDVLMNELEMCENCGDTKDVSCIRQYGLCVNCMQKEMNKNSIQV